MDDGEVLDTLVALQEINEGISLEEAANLVVQQIFMVEVQLVALDENALRKLFVDIKLVRGMFLPGEMADILHELSFAHITREDAIAQFQVCTECYKECCAHLGVRVEMAKTATGAPCTFGRKPFSRGTTLKKLNLPVLFPEERK